MWSKVAEPVVDNLLNYAINELLLDSYMKNLFTMLMENAHSNKSLFPSALIKISQQKPVYNLNDKIVTLFAEDDVTDKNVN